MSINLCALFCPLPPAVIEVVTSRTSNVERHREIQAAVKQAVGRALALLEGPSSRVEAAAAAAAASPVPGPALQPFELALHSASYHAYSLPLAKPLTTAAGGEAPRRHGFLLRLTLAGPGGEVHGVGEVAPLPGLHAESAAEAEAQLALICQLVAGGGVRVTLTAALLGGRLGAWLQHGLGLAPASLLPSVRCGLEAALLSALAQHQGTCLAQLLAGPSAILAPAAGVNGLLDCQGTPEEAAAEAAALLRRQPYAALKVKVGRRQSPLEDAAALLAIRQAVGPGVALRADANRRWSLEQAVEVRGELEAAGLAILQASQWRSTGLLLTNRCTAALLPPALQFGKAAAAAGLEYLEEPVATPADLAQFHRRTGIPLALDESVDEGE